jgi:hypothetical protein
MELTAAEREEFTALTKDSYDPDPWTEDDLPFLREFKRQFADARARESEVPPSARTEDHEDSDPGQHPDADCLV